MYGTVKTYAVTVEHGMVIIDILRSDWGRIASDWIAGCAHP